MASPASSYQTTSANQKPLLLQLKLWSCKCSDTTSDIGWKNLAANHLAAMNLQLDNQTVAAWQLRFFGAQICQASSFLMALPGLAVGAKLHMAGKAQPLPEHWRNCLPAAAFSRELSTVRRQPQ